MKESFLLVSLKEDQAKKLAQIVSSDTSRKILEFLSTKKDSTETEISKKLHLPISTVHYNLQQLVQGKLVDVEEFHYSKKGKEVNHYKLANKYIIIAPKTTFGFKTKLKSILPIALLMAVGAGFIQFFSKYSKFGFAKQLTTVTETFGREAVTEVEKIATGAGAAVAEETAPLAEKIPEVVQNITTTTTTTTIPPSPLSNIALWFFLGAVLTIAFYFIFEYIKYLKQK